MSALSLPPQVGGRIHGSLRLAVERISWRVVRPPESSQVRVKWWGEEGYGSLLRPAECVGLGPALTSSVYYSIRCSRPRLLEYFKDAASVRLDVVDERNHQIVAHASVDLAARCTGTSFSHDEQDEAAECIQDGPVAMYAKDGSKVGELTVCLDLQFKHRAQRTSFELNELMSQTDPTLQLYPSTASTDNSNSLSASFLSDVDYSASTLKLSTVYETSREAGGWSTSNASSHATQFTPQHLNASSRTPGGGVQGFSMSTTPKAQANTGSVSPHSMLIEEGTEAAERLVQILAEAEDVELMSRRAGLVHRLPNEQSRPTLASMSEAAAVAENGDSCSICCDSSAIQRGGVSGAGSMVEVHGGSRLHGIDVQDHLEDGLCDDGRNVLDFSMDHCVIDAPGARVQMEAKSTVPGGRSLAKKDMGRVSAGQNEQGESNAKEMDVLSQLLQKGRQMLQKLDDLAQSGPLQEGGDAAAPGSTNDSSETQTMLDSKLSGSLEGDLGSSMHMSEFANVYSGVVDDLCRIGLDAEHENERLPHLRGRQSLNASSFLGEDHPGDIAMANYSAGSGHDTRSNTSNVDVSITGTKACAAGEDDGDFCLSVHISLVSIGGGRVTSMRPGDMIYIHMVLTVPTVGDDVVNTTLHEQLRVPVPPELPEGAAVSVENAVRIRLSSQQLVALRDCSSSNGHAGKRDDLGSGGLEVRVLHQPRARIYGESGFKDVGTMKAVGVATVDLEKVWSASRWTGIVHLKFCEGQEPNRKVVTGKDLWSSRLSKGKSRIQNVASGSKAASRYPLASQKFVGTDGISAQSVVGRVELAVSLLTLPPEDKTSPVKHVTIDADARLVEGEERRDVKEKEEQKEEEPTNEGHEQQAHHRRTDINFSTSGARTSPVVEAQGKNGGLKNGESGQEVWLLQLQDVVRIKWENALRVTCRMVWVQDDERRDQPLLKTCLCSRPGRSWNADRIQISAFQPNMSGPRLTSSQQSSKGATVRSLFGGKTAAARPLIVLELWELDVSGMSKKLMGLVKLQLDEPESAAKAAEEVVCGCSVMMDGSFPVHSPFSGKDVGAIQLSLLRGAAADIESMIQRYDTVQQIKSAAQSKLQKLRARQCEQSGAEAQGDICDSAKDVRSYSQTSQGVVYQQTGSAVHKAEQDDTGQSTLQTHTRHGIVEAASVAQYSTLRDCPLAVPRPLELRYRPGVQRDPAQHSSKTTHTITLTIVGIARLPALVHELDVSTSSCGGSESVRDSSDMMLYRPCGIYVRAHVPGDADETLTPVVPVCSHLALHSQSSRTFVLNNEQALLDGMSVLVDKPSWEFHVMHRPKGTTEVSDRQIAHASLPTGAIKELLSGDHSEGFPITCALSLPVNVTPGSTEDAGVHDCTMRVRLTYEQTPHYCGEDNCEPKTLLASAQGGNMQGDIEYSVQNSLQLRNFRVCGLKAAADKIAQNTARCRLVSFDGPNTCVVMHLSPAPPWQKLNGTIFHASETVVHSFSPEFAFSRDMAIALTEEAIQYFNTAVLVVEAWHRMPRTGLEEFQPVHPRCHDPRVVQGVVHSRDLLMASASVPLQPLLLRKNGISGWHILHSQDGAPVGAVEFMCKLGVPALPHPNFTLRSQLNDDVPSSSQSRFQREELIEIQLLLEEVLIDGMEEVDYAFMAAPDGRRTLEFEYSLCGLEESRSCSRLLTSGTGSSARVSHAGAGQEAHGRRVEVDHCCSIAVDAGLENFNKLLSEPIRVSCDVVQGNMVFSLGAIDLDLGPLLTRARTPMDGEVQWLGGTHHLVQHGSSRLLARVRLKAALRVRQSIVSVHAATEHALLDVEGIPHARRQVSQHCQEAAIPTVMSNSESPLEGASVDSEQGTCCTVVIERASGLALDAYGNEPDTFVTCNVQRSLRRPELSDTTKSIRTKIVSRSCNPRWLHKEQVLLDLDWKEGCKQSRELLFEIWVAPTVRSPEDRASQHAPLSWPSKVHQERVEVGSQDLEMDEKGGAEAQYELVGCARVDLFQIQRGGAAIDGWYHILAGDGSVDDPVGAIKVAVFNPHSQIPSERSVCVSCPHVFAPARSFDWLTATSDRSHAYAEVTPSAVGDGAVASVSLQSVDEPSISSVDLRESLRRNMSELDNIQLRLRNLHDPSTFQDADYLVKPAFSSKLANEFGSAQSSFLDAGASVQQTPYLQHGEIVMDGDLHEGSILGEEHNDSSGGYDPDSIPIERGADLKTSLYELSSSFEPQNSSINHSRVGMDGSRLSESVLVCESPCYANSSVLNRCMDFNSSACEMSEDRDRSLVSTGSTECVSAGGVSLSLRSEAPDCANSSAERNGRDSLPLHEVANIYVPEAPSSRTQRTAEHANLPAIPAIGMIGDANEEGAEVCEDVQEDENGEDEVVEGWISRASQCLNLPHQCATEMAADAQSNGSHFKTSPKHTGTHAKLESDSDTDTDLEVTTPRISRCATEGNVQGKQADACCNEIVDEGKCIHVQTPVQPISSSVTKLAYTSSTKSNLPASTIKPILDKTHFGMHTPSSESYRSFFSAASTCARHNLRDSPDLPSDAKILKDECDAVEMASHRYGVRVLQFEEVAVDDSDQERESNQVQRELRLQKAKSHMPSDAHLERIARILQLGM